MIVREPTKNGLRHAAVHHIATALDHVEEAIVVLSVDRRVQYLNDVAKDLFDRDDSTPVPLPTNAWKQLEQGLAWTGHIEVPQEAGERRLRIDVRPIAGLDGDPSLLVIAHDVTEVERLQSIADSVNLSDNMGHFLSGIRHELGNPVNTIKTALTVLRSNLRNFPPKKVEDYIDQVLSEVMRIEFLLRSLRSFSRHESVMLSRVEVPRVIANITALVRPGVRASGVTLTVQPPPSESVIADERALYQILLNLFGNAIEAPPDRADPAIRLETSAGPDFVDIAVVDNGPGMTPGDVALAMRPFFTTKPTGTGLGLVIAQRLASTQGGRLRLYSARGEGTRAVVSLVRAPAKEEKR